VERNGSHLLTLRAEPWGSFQLRNVHKTNVGWSSYPFLPPTAADGLLASVAGGHRWTEGAFHPPRSLRTLEGYVGLAALGGYPENGRTAGPHFRTHVGTTGMSYDGPLWMPPAGVQSAGKKPAMVEEYLCDALRFIVVGEREALIRLWEKAIGRVSPFAKKGSLRFQYEEEPDLEPLSPGEAASSTETLVALPMVEIGTVPRQARPHLMPVRSRSRDRGASGYEVTWSHMNCVWESGLRMREGTPVLLTRDGPGISKGLLDAVLEE
jgi:hypothetical protein